MIYINISYRGGVLETVDQFDTRKEAYKMLLEYQVSNPSGHYHISSRATKEWRESIL